MLCKYGGWGCLSKVMNEILKDDRKFMLIQTQNTNFQSTLIF